tara:strand:- start:155 stop:367 length:213 start_codon:yes stop_codon:yes gene_type:complete
MIITSILNFFKKKKNMNKEENYPDVCQYSGLPSVSSYIEEGEPPDESHVPDFIDYDGMGNQGRFVPMKKK